MYPRKKLQNFYEGEMKPFKIIDNLYYVGSYKECCHLVNTGDGLMLIDVGSIKNVYLIINSIYQLGFSPYDVKYILLTHRHNDHIGGVKELAGLTKAKTYISERCKKYLEDNNIFEPTKYIKDGDKLIFGNIEVNCIATPGHTEDTISFIFDMAHEGRIYKVGMFGGAGPATLTTADGDHYDGCREDYINSCDRLLKEKVDVMLGNHCWNNNLDIKAKEMTKEYNPFLDNGAEWRKFLTFCKERALKICETDSLELVYKKYL